MTVYAQTVIHVSTAFEFMSMNMNRNDHELDSVLFNTFKKHLIYYCHTVTQHSDL